MPFYRIFCSLILTPLGIIWYFKTTRKDGNYGIIHPGRSIWRSMAHRSKVVSAVVCSVLIVAAIGGGIILLSQSDYYMTANVIPLNITNGSNLLLNPSFENGTPEMASNWSQEYIHADYSRVTYGVVDGNYAQHISYAGRENDSMGKVELFQGILAKYNNNGSNDRLTFSIYISGSLSKCCSIIGIEGFRADNSWINETDLYIIGLTNSPQQYSVNYEIPPGCVAVAAYVQVNEINPGSSLSITLDDASLTYSPAS